ncbi:MAG: glycosyltransferase family A protein [Gemella sp.]|nr:glycosyltransferase family A protein [Gemella sp.]
MISIIIPCYNSSKTLNKCFESLKKQTYKDFELIFINDGSIDNTLELLEEIKKNNTEMNIEIINQKNAGVSAARNVGLRLARGEYISFVDPDDSVEETFLETLFGDMTSNDVDISVIGVLKSTSLPRNRVECNKVDKEEFITSIFQSDMTKGYSWNKLFKKKILVDNTIYFKEDLSIMEDLEFCLNYANFVESVYLNTSQLYDYYISEDGIMTSSWQDKKMSVIKTFDYILSMNFSKKNRIDAMTDYTRVMMWLVGQVYRKAPQEDITKYENIIFKELDKYKWNFIRNGYKTGLKYYISYILYLLNKKFLRLVIR